MNTATATLDSIEPLPPLPRAHALRVLLLETRAECLRLLRYPGFSVPTLAFPLLFYVMFGIVLVGIHHDADSARHILASFSAYGVLAPGLFGVGVVLAIERERGLLLLKRALPVPAGAYLGAKLIASTLFAAAVTFLLLLIGYFAGHVVLSPMQYLMLTVTDVLGVLPFCAIGLLIGAMAPASGAPAVANLIFLPMAVLSGLWIPIWLLPQVLQDIAPAWPAYHLGQLALHIVDSRNDNAVLFHVGMLIATTVLFFSLASRKLARG